MKQSLVTYSFEQCRTSVRSHFIRCGSKREYNAREKIYVQGDKAQNIFYLESGIIKIIILSETGNERIIGIHGPGTIFGEGPLFSERSVQVTNVTALGDCTVYSMSPEAAFKNGASITIDIIYALSEKLLMCISYIEQISFMDAPTRIIRIIFKLSHHYGFKTSKGTKINLYLTHEELGLLCGVSRVTVTTTLNKLIREGILIKENRNLVVVDEESLRAMLK